MSTAESLSAGIYTQPEAFQRERRSVFGNAWLLLARLDVLGRPGQYVAQSLGGWPVFAIADQGGALRAFRNVCRHQKLPLFDSGAGHCEQIRCRYHGWTYDIAGRFVTAPPQAPPTDALSRDLQPVADARLHDLLFVHLDEDPPKLATALPELASALDEVRLDKRGFQGETITDIDANWKLVIEAALADHGTDIMRTVAWPCLVLDRVAEGAVVHQVIARSFHRTRIHHHIYGAPAAGERATMEAMRWKAGALARGAALEAGVRSAVPSSPELEAFRARVRAAHADDPPT